MKRMILALMAAGLLGGCATTGGGGGVTGAGGTAQLQSSPSQPAAEGAVKFGIGKNDNTKVDLQVKHLAKPDRLQPSESSYVVWVKKDSDSPAQNIGALQVDKNLTGTLNTVTALHKFDLFVTAEANGQVQEPRGEKQLWTSFSR